MSNRTSAQIVSYTVLAVLFLLVMAAAIVLLDTSSSTSMLRTLFANSSFATIVISMLIASVITLLCAIIIFYKNSKRENERQVPSHMEQVIDEVLRLEQQKSELEKKQEMLIWQMEAVALAKQDPRLAVVIAYQGVEAELQRVANLRYPKDLSEELDGQDPRVFYNVSLLEEAIGSESTETLKQMHDLRNRIVHGEVSEEEVSQDKATEYVQQAISLAGIISSFG